MGAFASQQNGTLDFRDGSTSDISTALIHVRFTPESGHSAVSEFPLWVNSGQSLGNVRLSSKSRHRLARVEMFPTSHW
jgi:hypothetical protein